jgi:hypothetical protein
MKVNSPTILQPRVQASEAPVAQEPEPPGSSELSVSLLVELDVTKDGERHEQDQSGVKEDQPGLDNMAVICSSVREIDKGVIDWPNRIKAAEKTAIAIGYPDSRMVAYTTGIVIAPINAQKPLIPTYGT